jgi:Cu-processing system permease protein
MLSRYILYDILRSKIIIAYTLLLLIITMSMFQMEENSGKAMISLLNVVLIIVPLISLVFATIHYYNSHEFIELMLSQPLSRSKILLSEWSGVCLALLFAFLVGVGIPTIIYANSATGLALLFIGFVLTLVFTSLAFFVSVLIRDKAKGIGIALLLWFYFALIYDGLVMLILFSFADYPLEKATLVLTAFNPIDLGRIFIILRMDESALMGYTGALYKEFFGSAWGMLFVFGIMLLWIVIPIWLALRYFKKKDL